MENLNETFLEDDEIETFELPELRYFFESISEVYTENETLEYIF